MANPPRVFTIPASAPFLPTLIGALLDGRVVPGFTSGADPLALAGATLYLPTRRAARTAREVFLDVLGSEAAILPRLVAVGDVDQDELAFDEAAREDFAGATLDIPEALGGLERRLLLASLVMKWASTAAPQKKDDAPLIANNPAAALALADDLARLMDDLTMRQVPFDQLDGLVPDDVDVYWQETLKFLKIAREQWPAILAERNKIEPAARRDRLIKAEAERLKRAKGPVVAAGSTGSIPVTAELLATIANLPHGAVVLPGLDTDLDPPSWDRIGGDAEQSPAAGHSQFALYGLLKRVGIVREGVKALAPPHAHSRERIVSEALRPAAVTELWRERLATPEFAQQAETAFSSISVIEASNAEEEALAVAVALREAVETPGKTAALATPDRALGRRVLAALARWNLSVNDSGGDKLPDTPASVFARLTAEAALSGLAPVTLLALLKHPLLRLGERAEAYAEAVTTLELAILRGPRPKPGTAGLIQALQNFRTQRDCLYRTDPRKSLTDRALDDAEELARRLALALAPLEKLPRRAVQFAELAACHLQALQVLGTDKDKKIPAFAGADGGGEALTRAFAQIAEHASAGFAMAPPDYPDFFRTAIADRIVRRPDTPGTRIHIYGLLEARLQSVDRLVLGGLVEGTWPPETRTDPWLNRPMRHALGLDLPERRIGLSAHDFAQSLGTKEVLLTRAAKLAGAPTVASRFVQRLQAVAGKERWDGALARGEKYLQWARALDEPPAPAKPVARPRPRPRIDMRPASLSVTEIELLLRDPYSVYARHILHLQPLDPVDTPPGARDRGTVIHEAIGTFTEQYKDGMPADALEQLLRLGKENFAPLEDFPDARAFWWPRFCRVARWFIDFENERRAKLKRLDAEKAAKLDISLGNMTFTLRTRADRIEHLDDGRYAILDYKTGRTPTTPQVRSGLSPQLTLEGAILRKGGFEGIPAGASIAEYSYVSLRGGEPPGERKQINIDPDTEADRALQRLTEVLIKFADPEIGYLSRERPMFMNRGGGDYDHLARTKEWSLTGGVGDEEGESE